MRKKWESFLCHLLQLCANKVRNRHLLVLDSIALLIMPYVSLALCKDGRGGVVHAAPSFCCYAVSALILRLVIFQKFGLYKRYWKEATIDDLGLIVLGVGSATLAVWGLFVAGVRTGNLEASLPGSLPILSGLLTLLIIGGSRFGLRLARRMLHLWPQPDAKPVLIIGAGRAGRMVARELQTRPDLGLKPLAFIDDDVSKHHLRILNLPVLGGREALPEIAARYAIEQAIIALPTAPGKTIRELLQLCTTANIPAKTVPPLSAIINEEVCVSALRDVEIEDLLRREPVQTDLAAIAAFLRGKRVLVTGAGGSIGSELCRQVLKCCPAELALIGHGENSLFDIHNELVQQGKEIEARDAGGSSAPVLHPYIADIRHLSRIRRVLDTFRPDIIFHAAAHKHVPLMEMNPAEAITNNVFGTKNLLDAALAAGVENFLMISTDKAVNPTSVMGTSKRIAEMLVLRAARNSGKSYLAVRFGNVLGSRGSVVPTFKRQIAAGGPVTVSHPEMRRYFMTIPEAVQLVLQATLIGRGGEIFMLDMGEPVKILDLARDLIRLSGLEPDRDIDIHITGTRPGEKLYEELFIPGECYHPTHHEKIRMVENASRLVPSNLDEALHALRRAVVEEDNTAVIQCLKSLVPEFRPDPRHKRSITRRGLEAEESLLAQQHASDSEQPITEFSKPVASLEAQWAA